MLHTTWISRMVPDGDAEREVEIEVEFTLTGGHNGSPPSLSDPGESPEAPELEVTEAVTEDGEIVELTDAELERVREDVFSRVGDFVDDGYEEF